MGKLIFVLYQMPINREDSRDNLNHFRSIRSTPDIAFVVISLNRTAFSSSTIGSVTSSLSASCPFAKLFRRTAEVPLTLRFP